MTMLSTKTRKALLAVSVTALGCFLPSLSAHANTTTITFTTAQSRFTSGINNQGWWSGTLDNTNTNASLLAGIQGTNVSRNFFTFDLSPLNLSGQTLLSAQLKVVHGAGVSTSGKSALTYGLFDVSTSAATLNNNTGRSTSIFNDLGTGISYGGKSVTVADSPSAIVTFDLNANALNAIRAAAGGRFSIGGAIQGLPLSGAEFLFASNSAQTTQSLVLVTRQDPRITPVPEVPASVTILTGFAAVMGLMFRTRFLKKAQS